MKNTLKLSSFTLHLIAIIAMSIDHLAEFLVNSGIYANMDLYWVLKIIGRLAFTLYAFFIVQGVLHTSNFKKYIGRLGLMALIILVMDIVLVHGFSYEFGGNIFFTLLAGALLVYYFEKKKYLHLYLLIPAIYIIVVDFLEIFNVWHPVSYLSAMYGGYGIILILGFYLAVVFARIYTRNVSIRSSVDKSYYIENGYYQFAENGFGVLNLLVITVIFYVSSIVWPPSNLLVQSIQSYALLTAIPIFFYSGQRGYTSKGWKIFNYAYYPAHLLIFAIITLLVR